VGGAEEFKETGEWSMEVVADVDWLRSVNGGDGPVVRKLAPTGVLNRYCRDICYALHSVIRWLYTGWRIHGVNNQNVSRIPFWEVEAWEDVRRKLFTRSQLR
jgi:hypothetical protein